MIAAEAALARSYDYFQVALPVSKTISAFCATLDLLNGVRSQRQPVAKELA
jgi:hypothetical protein